MRRADNLVKSEELRVKSEGLHYDVGSLFLRFRFFTFHSSLFTIKQGRFPCFI